MTCWIANAGIRSCCPAPKTSCRCPSRWRNGCSTDRGRRGCSPGSSTSATTRATTGRSAPRTGCALATEPRARQTPMAGATRRPAGTLERSQRVFAWRITETRDPLGNLIRYEYLRDKGNEAGHVWDQPLISAIRYADYGERDGPSFLVNAEFEYESAAGSVLRLPRRVRDPDLAALPRDPGRTPAPPTAWSVPCASTGSATSRRRSTAARCWSGSTWSASTRPLSRRSEALPPLTFGYSGFEPGRRRFRPVTGRRAADQPAERPEPSPWSTCAAPGCPTWSSSAGTPRYWSNRGEGRFDLPRRSPRRPPHTLAAPGVALLDADGDGRADLLVADGTNRRLLPDDLPAGLEPSARFQPYRQMPSVGLDDPQRQAGRPGRGRADRRPALGRPAGVLVQRPRPRRAWQRTATASLDGRQALDLADPHVRLADMTGDGLQDIVLAAQRQHQPTGPTSATAAGAAWCRCATRRGCPTGYDPRRRAARRRRRRRARRPGLRRPRPGAAVGQPVRATPGPSSR